MLDRFVEWYQFIGFPRGLIAASFYSVFVAIPKTIIKKVFIKPNHPASWDVCMVYYSELFHFILANKDWKRVRNLSQLYDLVERIRIFFTGSHLETVRRLADGQVVAGTWIVSKGDILPNVHSVHQVIAALFIKEQKHPVQVESILSAYRWLVDHVGVRNIVLGGDSAGANLQILLHKQLIRDQTANPLLILPKSMVLVSPWLDVSLSHTPPHILSSLATSSDLLPFSMLETWRDNATPHGVNPRDPKISPFFDLSPFIMPVDGILLIYGSTEIFAPEIDDWVKSIRREKDVRSKLKVIYS
ncbi:hypothetical protein HDV02_001788 [Globomyces sp. JEL0801]|nr:hypothetical protein HDV02_001788 [Globomyces sp. JEL0801]